MAANISRLVLGCMLGIAAAPSFAEAAPPVKRVQPKSSNGTTGGTNNTKKPTTTKPGAIKPGATKPATPPEPPAKSTFDPPPIPSNGPKRPDAPQPPPPKREEDAPLEIPQMLPTTKAAPLTPRTAAETTVAPNADGKYLLQYHFSTGETLRWEVVHQAKIVTSAQGSTQAAETTSASVKVWKIEETLPGGETRFVHLVESIDMRQKLTGRTEVRYDSRVDAEPPPVFAEAAKQVGIPLAEVTIDARGVVLKRADRTKRPEGTSTNTMALNLPDRPMALGESWSSPFDIAASNADGQTTVIKARNKLTLEKVEGSIAFLRYDTDILSPVDDPTIESQVVQYEQQGRVKFDLKLGRLIERTSDLDREVFGFQGPDSKMHFVTQFTERLLDNPELGARNSERTETR